MNAERGGARALVALGLLLAGAGFVALASIPTGPAEFAYAPYHLDHWPWSPMRGFTVEQALSHGIRALVLGPACVLLAVGLSRGGWVAAPDAHTRAQLGRLAGVVGLGGLAVVMLGVIRGRPLITDEQAYALQATLLAHGRVALDYPFNTGLMQVVYGVDYGQNAKYLPAEALAQVPGVWLGVPALAHLPLAALAAFALYRGARPAVGEATAIIAALALLVSPMFLFTSALGLSHTTSLTGIALLFWSVGTVGAAAPGVRPWEGWLPGAIGVVITLLCRPQVAVPMGPVLAGWHLVTASRAGRRGAAAALVASGVVGLGLVLGWNQAFNGDPFDIPWDDKGQERYGFGRPIPFLKWDFTPWGAVQNLVTVLIRLNAWWLGFPASLAVVGVWWRLGAPRAGLGALAAAGLALTLFDLGYYSPGVGDTGAIYHFELLLPLSLLAAHTVVAGWRLDPRATTAWLLAHLVVGTGSFLVEHGARIGRYAAGTRVGVEPLDELPPRSLVLLEPACSTFAAVGWLDSQNPLGGVTRWDDPVVLMAPPRGADIPEVLAHHPDRTCVYAVWSRHAPMRLLPCDRMDATRIAVGIDPRACFFADSTATTLGLDPDPAAETDLEYLEANAPR